MASVFQRNEESHHSDQAVPIHSYFSAILSCQTWISFSKPTTKTTMDCVYMHLLPVKHVQLRLTTPVAVDTKSSQQVPGNMLGDLINVATLKAVNKSNQSTHILIPLCVLIFFKHEIKFC